MLKRRLRQGTMLLAGLAAGFLLALLAAYLYFRAVSDAALAESVIRTVGLPPSAFELERVEGDSIAVVSASEIVVRSEEGDTMFAAPTARLRVRLSSLSGDGPIVADEVRLLRPYVNFEQSPSGEINLTQAMVVTAGGQELEGEEGRPIELRDVRLEDARIRVVTPYEPDSLSTELPPDVRLARSGGSAMRLRWARNVDARLPLVRVGGGQGWRVEIAALTAMLTDPATRIAQLAGFAEAPADGPITFGLRELRTGQSVMAASGTLEFTENGVQVDVEGQVQPLAFSDARWFVPALPEDGTARGAFAVQGGVGSRLAIGASDLEVEVRDSRITGYLSAEIGGDAPAAFGETRLSLEPLRIETVRSFGIGADLPYTGEITGTVSSAGGVAGDTAELQLDLTAAVTPESRETTASTIFVQGPIALTEEMEVRFAGLRVAVQPLYLEALRPLSEENADRLRGVLRGSVILEGTPRDLQLSQGRLDYEVGEAPVTTLTEISASIRLDPELRFDLSTQAQPIALGTLAALFPGLPFRSARFAGPLRLSGTADEVRIDAQLAGSAGSIMAQGAVWPGDPLRFDVNGEVAAFNAEAVLARSVPMEGPVTGTFQVNGSSQQFAFNVDLAQEGEEAEQEGRFALAGTFRSGTDAPALIDVAGDVSNFNLGAVIGRPRLFPSRMTGRIELTGGGTDPYRFAVDLRGQAGILDLSGYYLSGKVPLYAASGQVVGLDLRQLPGLQLLPSTSLRGTVELEGQGTSLETLAGSLRFNALGSTVGGMRLDRLNLDLAVDDGVLQVRTLEGGLAGTQLSAQGRLGLSRPVSGNPLQIRAVSRDLSRLAPLASGVTGLPPRLTGSFVMQATLTGSIRAPVVTAYFRGQELRYERYLAERLELDADLAIGERVEQIEGSVLVSGDGLALPNMTMDSLRFAADGTQDSMAVRLAVTREAGSDIQLRGALELEGREPRGLLLDSLLLRAGLLVWDLEAPAEVRWGGPDGVQVSNFVLRSRTDPNASVRIAGQLPESGATDLRMEVRRLDLELVRRLLPDAPDLGGVVDLDLLLQGTTQTPRLVARAYGSGLRYQGVLLDSMSLNAQYDAQRLVTEANLWQGSVPVAVARAEIPMTVTLDGVAPSGELIRTEPVVANIRADSLPLGLLTAGSSQVSDGAGMIVGQLDLQGTAEDPLLSGYATVINGAVTAPQLGRRFERISGHFILDEQQILIDSLVVWSAGRGEVNGSVRVTDLERPELYLTASFDGFHAIDNRQIANLTMSGNVRLEGVMPEPVLTGSVRLQDGAIYIPSLGEQVPLEIANVDVGQVGADTAVAAAIGPSLLEQVRISGLEVAVEEGVWLESDEANVQIRGDLVVIRNGPDMQLFGTMEAVRGTYTLPIGPLYREFEVVSGSVRFLGTPNFNPEIDITAEHEVQAGTAGGQQALAVLVHLTGTLENPSIELTSNTRPPLPESELLSWLVFGQPSFRLNQGTGALAQQLVIQEFVGGLLSRQLNDLGLPCEYFRLRGRPNLLNLVDPLGATSLECGVQVVEDLFLTLETGVLSSLRGDNSSVRGTLFGLRMDWRVNDQLTTTIAREPVQSALGTLYITASEIPYQFSVEVRGTWEFEKPRQTELPVPDLEEDSVVESAPIEAVAPPDTLSESPEGGGPANEREGEELPQPPPNGADPQAARPENEE